MYGKSGAPAQVEDHPYEFTRIERRCFHAIPKAAIRPATVIAQEAGSGTPDCGADKNTPEADVNVTLEGRLRVRVPVLL